jgi:hypothetical protein
MVVMVMMVVVVTMGSWADADVNAGAVMVMVVMVVMMVSDHDLGGPGVAGLRQTCRSRMFTGAVIPYGISKAAPLQSERCSSKVMRLRCRVVRRLL